ncbi:MAG: biopolymer transporter ExbD [Bacteroidetes bacterium]|nr:biopolymer transporter ExbD [Bacteroidota bacterium]
MRLRRKSRTTSEVSTSSLNDIMFFLMLFFLIMSTMVAPSVVKINLPKTNAGKAISKQNIVLAVDSNLNYFVNNEKITFPELEQRLMEIAQKDTSKEPTIVLQASKKLSLQDVVDVMSVGTKLKMKMVLATSNK